MAAVPRSRQPSTLGIPMAIRSLVRQHYAGIGAAGLALALSLGYWIAASTHPALITPKDPGISLGTPIHLLSTTETLGPAPNNAGSLFTFANLKPGDTRTSDTLTLNYNDPRGSAAVFLQLESPLRDGSQCTGTLCGQMTLTVHDNTTHRNYGPMSFTSYPSTSQAGLQICGTTSSGSTCANWGNPESHQFMFSVSVPNLDNSYQNTKAAADIVWTATGTGAPNLTITRDAGNLKVKPGDDLAGGWSFQILNSHPSTNVSFQNAQIAFPIVCANGSTPSSSSITLPLAAGYPQPQTYTTDPLNASQWYPNANGAAHESYENAQQPFLAPDLCGGGTMLVKSATFSALVTANPVVPEIKVRFHYTDGGT